MILCLPMSLNGPVINESYGIVTRLGRQQLKRLATRLENSYNDSLCKNGNL